MILVDANVLLDIFTDDPRWADWSEKALLAAGEALALNPVVYAELAPAFREKKELDAHIGAWDFRHLAISYEAAFLAGKVFVTYRRKGGQKRAPLPDFFIGAQAQLENLKLLTRDAARYRSYFPGVELIAP